MTLQNYHPGDRRLLPAPRSFDRKAEPDAVAAFAETTERDAVGAILPSWHEEI